MEAITRKKLCVSVDFGSTTIRVMGIEYYDLHTSPTIKYVGCAPAAGIKRGMITNMAAATVALRSALQAAGIPNLSLIDGTVALVGCEQVEVKKQSVSTAILYKYVRGIDIQRLEKSAQKAVPHKVPIWLKLDNYSIDGVAIEQPRGIHGKRLTAQSTAVYAPANTINDIKACCKQAGLRDPHIWFTPLATATAAYDPMTVPTRYVLIEMGGDNTHVVHFEDGDIVFSKTIPIGGNLITHDLAVCLKTPLYDAEHLKRRYSSEFKLKVLASRCNNPMTTQTTSGFTVGDIITARVNELLNLIASAYHEGNIPSETPIILAGEASHLSGIQQSLNQLFKAPVNHSYIALNWHNFNSGEYSTAYMSALGGLHYYLSYIAPTATNKDTTPTAWHKLMHTVHQFIDQLR